MSRFVLIALALLGLGFEWEGRLTRLRRELGSEDPAVRREVVRLLASYPASEVGAPLLAALEDPDAGVRIEAAEAVGRVRVREAVPRLLDWLDDPEADVRAAAASALGQIGERSTIPNLVRVLGDSHADVRRAGAAALAAIGGDDVIVPILGRLDDVDARVRVDAATLLGQLGDPRAAVPLVGRARDDAPEVRTAVYTALGDLGDDRAVAALVQGLRDEVPEPRLAAIAALGRIGSEESVRPLVALLGSTEDARAARAITAALGQIPGATAEDALVRALSPGLTRTMASQTLVERARRISLGTMRGDASAIVAALGSALREADDPAHATQIARTLYEISDGASIEASAPALSSALREGRGDPASVLRALGATGSPDALVPLLERVVSEEVRVRMAVLDALGRYFERAPPDGRAADPLLAVLGQVTPPEREPVITLLGRVGAPRALPALRTLLAHEDPAIRLAAIRAIGAIGDPDGAPAVLPLLDDPDSRLRYEAARAVGRSASAGAIAALLERAHEHDEPVDRHAILIALAMSLPRLTLPEPIGARAIASLLAFADGPDEGLAARALDVLGAWHPPAALSGLIALAQSASPTRSLAVLRALGSYDDDAARAVLREALGASSVSASAQAASVLGEHGTRSDAALLLARAPELRWPASASAAFALARLARRGQLEVASAHEPLCRLARSHDPFVRANVAIAMAAIAGPPCAAVGPLDWLDPEHAGVVRAASARWARAAADAGHLPAATVDPALAACAAEPLTPELGAICARPTLSPLEASADVYAYAPDGMQLWTHRLIALRLSDGTVWLTYSDANGHVRLANAPRGELALEDPAATPLEP